MQPCPVCGATNRADSRFCALCGTPLLAVAAPRPSSADHAWLAATLLADASSHVATDAPAGGVPAAAPAIEERGMSMDQHPPQPAPARRFGDRYEQVVQVGDAVEVIDREPWRRCWACGATSNERGEAYCVECGAALEGAHYRGVVNSGDPAGLALVPEVADQAARAALPQIWDDVQDGSDRLVLAVNSTRPPLAPPLAELDALRVGLGLARLLLVLHNQGFTLGALAPEDIEQQPTGWPRLRDVPGLQRGGQPADDLRALGELLEALTATPRTTQRLDDAQAAQAAAEPGLPGVLRALRTGQISSAAALADQLDDLLADKTQPLALRAHVGARSDTGVVRDHNEDGLLALDLRTDQNATGRSWGLYIVADGMGGHSAGEVASGLAIRGATEAVLRGYLTPTLESDAEYAEDQVKDAVLKAIVQANDYVLREAHARGNDMGTTITMAVVAGDRAVIGNVGDSRTYLYRDGQLRRISKDHSLVQRLVDLGQIAPDDAYTHPQRNAVLRSLGDKADVGIDLFVERLRPGDALLCCSDGLWEMVRDPQMVEILQQHADPQAACDALIAQANANGGEDNISAVLVAFGTYGS